MEKENNKVVKEERFLLVEVPTQMTTVIKDITTDEHFDINLGIVKILNELDIIKKAVA